MVTWKLFTCWSWEWKFTFILQFIFFSILKKKIRFSVDALQLAVFYILCGIHWAAWGLVSFNNSGKFSAITSLYNSFPYSFTFDFGSLMVMLDQSFSQLVYCKWVTGVLWMGYWSAILVTRSIFHFSGLCCMNAIFNVHYDMIIKLLCSITHLHMHKIYQISIKKCTYIHFVHLKTIFWLISSDMYFSLNVFSNVSNLLLDPLIVFSISLIFLTIVFKLTNYTNTPGCAFAL